MRITGDSLFLQRLFFTDVWHYFTDRGGTKMKVSVRKISEITGFSPATVSNALNYKKGVNAETSAKIF